MTLLLLLAPQRGGTHGWVKPTRRVVPVIRRPIVEQPIEDYDILNLLLLWWEINQ